MTRVLILFGLLCTPFVYAQSIVVDRIISVYDADTFRVDIDSWPQIIGKNMSIRVNGVDAAEIRGKCPSEKLQAKMARDFTRAFLKKGHLIELRGMKRGKYFRLIADVYVDGKSLSKELISLGLARPYDGGHRDGWCSTNTKDKHL